MTLLFLVLHTHELEDEGLLLTELVALATLGRMQVVSLVTLGKPACRNGEKWTGQWSGWHKQSQVSLLKPQTCEEGQVYGIAWAA